jgi:hypothetical protein
LNRPIGPGQNRYHFNAYIFTVAADLSTDDKLQIFEEPSTPKDIFESLSPMKTIFKPELSPGNIINYSIRCFKYRPIDFTKIILLHNCPSYGPKLQMPNEQPAHGYDQHILDQVHIIEHSIEPLLDQIISEAFIVIRQHNKWEHHPEGLVGDGCGFWVEAYP